MEIGNTPLLEIDGIFIKQENLNPTGSIKDRMVKYILDKSEQKGLLKKGTILLEATSGNTGIALSYFGKQKGYKVIIIMPCDMSQYRKQMIKELGAELILCSKSDFLEAARIRDLICDGNPKYFSTQQFDNELNIKCHYQTTANEIIEQVKQKTKQPIAAFVAGVGTGGTFVGVSKKLKEVYPNIKTFAVEPTESEAIAGSPKLEPHIIQGIGDGFVPSILNNNLDFMDYSISISGFDSLEAAKRIPKQYKSCCMGISSGCNFLAAQKVKQEYGIKGPIVTIFADGCDRYKEDFNLNHCENCNCQYCSSKN